jgi:myo-inositol-1(or 4)-monophosphatase
MTATTSEGTGVPAGAGTVRWMTDDDLLEVLDATVEAVRDALAGVGDWRPSTERSGQYAIDVVADRAAVDVLLDAGLGVLSEESGIHAPEREVVVVVDPVDGSTNASRGLPWFNTSLCALDADGARAAVVTNLATGERFDAVRGGGARLDGRPIRASACDSLGDAMVALSGAPPSGPWPWRQYRTLGAAALDLCAVACGRVDAYVDATAPSAHGAWDYLGGMLVCQEAGAVVADALARPLVHRDHGATRSPVAAATPALLEELLERLHAEHGRGPSVRP